ncbi:ribonuclease H-like domain-containing protein [Haloimpatiens sp. FM7330]|uniref:ribonuclease H-like domain-containing protein n=1 Tax=Haloimpatiens sp. FM7330 TaxID=3298610 RepID=UPI0036327D1A
MFIKECTNELKIKGNVLKTYNMKDICYFDIETTGFNKEQDKIMLVSIGYFIDIDKFHIKQYFAEDIEDEKELLMKFKEDIISFNTWCSYNGIAFDEAFILKRMDKYEIEFESPLNHVDLYRIIRPYYEQLGMNRCNLKTVEKFIGIDRTDEIDGGQSVDLYYEYLECKNDSIKNVIMLHNFEDVLDLPLIFNLVYKIDMDDELERKNLITKKQLKYLKYLLEKNDIKYASNVEKISKKYASKMINMFVKDNVDIRYVKNALNNSY